ncbi:biotin synthase BioB [Sutcliffiella cohnii]|uniref:Biotin synthase n=1 Tax=Sutcliffiella cohnii TaxID=33932 RepID=A0A223KXT2_9BACI|nr:biotin synthase BioB [Sutcliffiella cohnii]AST94108.1 biotin synthase BioB [Sutcliffiella cohnii]
MNFSTVAQDVINGYELSKAEALSILQTDNGKILELVNAAYLIRHHYYQNKVKLNLIINAKSGLCPEDCGYCAQSFRADTVIDTYPIVSKQTIVEGAREAKRKKIGTYCIVMSGRRPTHREVNIVTDSVKEIKDEMDNIKICACLGLVNNEQAALLKTAGVDRFNHNINTSKEHHEQITTTHTYDDRIDTLQAVKQAGISPCSGVICGMGETLEDIVDMAFSLKELNVDSIPVNFLHPIKGTKLENLNELTPIKCLKILSLFRFVNPTKEIRISGGREHNLGTLQSLGLYIANSIFVGDYLTTRGQEVTEDYKMIEDLGFEIEDNPFETDAKQFHVHC